MTMTVTAETRALIREMVMAREAWEMHMDGCRRCICAAGPCRQGAHTWTTYIALKRRVEDRNR